MKNILSKFSKWAFAAVAAFSLVACTTDDADNSSNSDHGITISNVVATYNSVTFDVVATDAIAIAYIAVESGTTLTAQEVFDQGDAKGTTEGTFTYKGNGLNSDTAYILYVAAKKSSGNVGPASSTFMTEENTGAPTSDEASGIRVVEMGTNTLIWEVANGAAVDFSLTMVQPTILMENEIYEASKNNVSEETYISSFMATEDYAYIMGVTTGAGETATFNYSEIYSSYPMFPAGNYSIYTLACKGSYDDYTTIEPLELTRLDVTTESLERIGDPFVSVTHKYSDYIGIYHTITPNDDAKYWAKFFTQTSELEEYVSYFDALYGEGAGRKRLAEYVQQVDPYVIDQYGACDLYLNLDWGYSGINFSRLALGFDENLVPGDDYDESIAQVLEVGDTEPGRYTMQVDSIGAGNFRMTTTLGTNCKRVYWKLVTKGSLDSTLTDYDSAMAIAYALDAEGWVEFRYTADAPTTDDLTNAENQDAEFICRRFVWDEDVDSELDLVSVSLNYEGVLSYPVVSAQIKTLPRVLGDFEPSITITAETENISKTNILVDYHVHDDAYDNDERLLYSRFLSIDDPDIDNSAILAMSDDELLSWMVLENGATEANVWMLLLEDPDYPDSYNYSINWSGMNPSTTYRHFYCTENGKGEISKLSYTDFTTMSNDGGDSPAFTIKLDPENITVDQTAGTYGSWAYIVPNGDVVSFKYLNISESYLTSNWYNVETQLAKGLYKILMSEGMSDTVETAYATASDVTIGDKLYLAVQGWGANGVESQLSYVGYTSDGVVDAQVDVDITDYISAPAVPYDYQEATTPYIINNSILGCINERATLSSYTPAVKSAAKVTKNKITEADAAVLRSKGIEFYTFRELGQKSLLKEKMIK